MAFPAPQQAVISNEHFLNINLTEEHTPLSAAVLVQVRPNGDVADHARILIYGEVTMTAFFPASMIFSFREAKNVYFKMQCRPAEVFMELDRMSTAFVDLHASLQDGTFDTVNNNGEPIQAPELRMKLCSEGNEKNSTGACYRWAVAAVSGGRGDGRRQRRLRAPAASSPHAAEVPEADAPQRQYPHHLSQQDCTPVPHGRR